MGGGRSAGKSNHMLLSPLHTTGSSTACRQGGYGHLYSYGYITRQPHPSSDKIQFPYLVFPLVAPGSGVMLGLFIVAAAAALGNYPSSPQPHLPS